MSGGWAYWPQVGTGEDFVHTQIREYWGATGQLTPAQAAWPVDADEFRNLSFLASWGYVPGRPNTITEPEWGGPVLPVMWAEGWADPGPYSAVTNAWSAGWA